MQYARHYTTQTQCTPPDGLALHLAPSNARRALPFLHVVTLGTAPVMVFYALLGLLTSPVLVPLLMFKAFVEMLIMSPAVRGGPMMSRGGALACMHMHAMHVGRSMRCSSPWGRTHMGAGFSTVLNHALDSPPTPASMRAVPGHAAHQHPSGRHVCLRLHVPQAGQGPLLPLYTPTVVRGYAHGVCGWWGVQQVPTTARKCGGGTAPQLHACMHSRTIAAAGVHEVQIGDFLNHALAAAPYVQAARVYVQVGRRHHHGFSGEGNQYSLWSGRAAAALMLALLPAAAVKCMLALHASCCHAHAHRAGTKPPPPPPTRW